MAKCFAVLEARGDEISLVAARWSKSGDYIFEGFCRAGSKGIRRGIVTDVAAATDSIAKAMDKLRKRVGKRIQDVYAGVSSTSISIIPSSGDILLSKYGREISERDIRKCVQIGSTVKMPLDKESLHRIVRGFSVDGEKGIKNPLNLEGVKLGVKVNVVTINSSALRNLEKCISQAGFVSTGFVFSGLAAAYRVLTEEEKHRGVALLDISEDLSETMVFHKGMLTDCAVFSRGADDIRPDEGMIKVDLLEELAALSGKLQGWENIGKIVVIGKGAFADDLVESMEKIFKIPVKVGTCVPRPFEDLPPDRAGYIGILGMLDHLQEEKRRQRLAGNIFKKSFNKCLGFVDKYF